MDKKILMVCLGNICRSPLAEGILKSKIEANKINAMVDSVGIANFHVGETPDIRAQNVALKNNVNISKHKGRQFSVEDFDNFDKIYAMDMSNYSDIIELARDNDDKNKVDLILNELYPNENRSVDDPYYDSIKEFDNVYEILDKTCDKIIENLKI